MPPRWARNSRQARARAARVRARASARASGTPAPTELPARVAGGRAHVRTRGSSTA